MTPTPFYHPIYTLFDTLYGYRSDFREQAQRLVETMARQYILRADELKEKDLEREKDHNWFLSQKWTGMALYTDGFAGDLKNLSTKIPYIQELGVNMVHIMPIMSCPAGHSDGGYAVSNFRKVDSRVGAMEDLDNLSKELKKRDMLLTLDVVLNHTSDEHEWAMKAKQGETTYQDYYYIFSNREVPDMFEETMPEIFPETAPGNFTHIEGIDKWVMTVFKNYQWDLNYSNPAVFIEMMDIILFWANHGADIVRLDAVATKSTRLLNQGIKSLPNKLERATWLNYVRCHDDIGLGFDDVDIRLAGYEAVAHRRFLIDYFTGEFSKSAARGMPFGHNAKTGDARISASLASLAGLEVALEQGDPKLINDSTKMIILLHSMIMSFGGIPLIYYGDEIGTTNDYRYIEDERKSGDTRWMHRPVFDWDKAEQRHRPTTVESRIYNALKKMISVRKEIPAFADFNNREIRDTGNPHLFAYYRVNHQHIADRVLVVGNFDVHPQHMDISDLTRSRFTQHMQLYDLYSGEKPAMFNNALVIPPYHFYWLHER